jgi:hypothetical protein
MSLSQQSFTPQASQLREKARNIRRDSVVHEIGAMALEIGGVGFVAGGVAEIALQQDPKLTAIALLGGGLMLVSGKIIDRIVTNELIDAAIADEQARQLETGQMLPTPPAPNSH